MNISQLGRGLLVVCSVLLVAGCAGKVTGGGSLIGSAGRGTVAVNADSCGDAPKGQFQYVDDDANVRLHGTVVGAGQCVAGLTTCDCQALVPGFGLGSADYEIVADYRSADLHNAGSGQVIACVSDNGEGSKATGIDNASIHVISGPFAGYNNVGIVRGNVQQHECTGKTVAP